MSFWLGLDVFVLLQGVCEKMRWFWLRRSGDAETFPLEGYIAVAQMFPKVTFTFGYGLLCYFHKKGRGSEKDGTLSPSIYTVGFPLRRGIKKQTDFILGRSPNQYS